MAESTRHRRAFDAYVEMGSDRSIERLHQILTKKGRAPSLRTLYEWSRRYHWQQRLADLERRARVAADEARIAEIRKMQGRQAKVGLLLQQKGTEWLTELEGERATADAAIRAITEGARLERLARGEPTERISQGETDSRLEELDDEELDRLIALEEGGVEGEGQAGPH